MKKILNDLKLKFDNPNWALDPELALIDTVLEQHPELFEIVKGDIIGIRKDGEIGRQDSPTAEQIIRAALYKKIKKLDV
jgi:IS5 family transposase